MRVLTLIHSHLASWRRRLNAAFKGIIYYYYIMVFIFLFFFLKPLLYSPVTYKSEKLKYKHAIFIYIRCTALHEVHLTYIYVILLLCESTARDPVQYRPMTVKLNKSMCALLLLYTILLLLCG